MHFMSNLPQNRTLHNVLRIKAFSFAMLLQICCEKHLNEMVCGKISYSDFNRELMERFISISEHSDDCKFMQLIKEHEQNDRFFFAYC